MLRAMRTAASGMSAQQLYLDTIAHNLANVNTTGFKRARVDFEDLLYQTLSPATAGTGDGQGAPVALQVGHGSRPTDTEKIFVQGDTETTGNPLDILVQGDGFFIVQAQDGTEAYTRDGSFKLDADGRLVTAQGNPVQPEIVFPSDTRTISVSGEGRIFIEQAGTNGSTEIGQLLLARFPNPAGLTSEGGNILRESPASGAAETGNPGQVGLGSLLQGALERSNVQVVEEMVNMIMAQRAFEMNSKAIKSADDMMAVVVNIRPA
jgi:flagellar basal-body rod protein FlgG